MNTKLHMQHGSPWGEKKRTDTCIHRQIEPKNKTSKYNQMLTEVTPERGLTKNLTLIIYFIIFKSVKHV